MPTRDELTDFLADFDKQTVPKVGTYEETKGFPRATDMYHPALVWAMAKKGGYLGEELKVHLAELYGLTLEQLSLVSPKGVPVFFNRVDWVTARFTKTGIHTSIDGKPHRTPNSRYYLTSYGYDVGEGKVEWGQGPRGALPDPRQLG